MTTPWLEIITVALGGGAVGTLGKSWLDRRKGQDQLAATSERAFYTSLEARIAKLETREDELQEELKLRIERSGELETRNALLAAEVAGLRAGNEALREQVDLLTQEAAALREANAELRSEVDELRQHNARLSTELLTLRRAADQHATIQLAMGD